MKFHDSLAHEVCSPRLKIKARQDDYRAFAQVKSPKFWSFDFQQVMQFITVDTKPFPCFRAVESQIHLKTWRQWTGIYVNSDAHALDDEDLKTMYRSMSISDAHVLDEKDLKTMYQYMSIQMPMC